MAFDFSKIQVQNKESLPVDPIELFQKLKVSDSGINDLWLAQGDALREWHKNRLKYDLGVVLNTGAGKTLVGLLIAQSIVNETRGKVLYACSSIQLVEQTAEKAKGYGLHVTTYFHREFSNDLFTRGEAPCITTYQALFNGHSRFFREDLAGIVFDDAHAAEHLLRDHFSLRIHRDEFASIYSSIYSLFKTYHQSVGKTSSYEELSEINCRRVFLVPPFEIQKQLEELRRVLHIARFSDSTETTFAWEHIKDRIDLCCILISGTEITITPPFVPVLTLSYFNKAVRRVYLSATLAAADAFARTFGKAPDVIIAPSTTAGECERLIIISSRLKHEKDDVETTKQIIQEHKALILVPTYPRSSKWSNITTTPQRDKVSEAVKAFKSDTGKPKLLLAARYDGVDLPGDTCRVMVIDDLPMGVGPLERFMWEHLNLSNTLRTAIASRVIQSFGRISRGMSDHGVVFITGDKLVDWILTPRNAAVLPFFLQKQIQLGFAFSEETNTIEDLKAATKQCLSRDDGWLAAYDGFMKNAMPEKCNDDFDLLKKIAESEATFISHLWDRNYMSAAKCLGETLEDAFTLSSSTGAWHALWLGRAYELIGDQDLACELYSRAHANQLNIPPYPVEFDSSAAMILPNQICEVDRQFKINGDKINLPKNFHKNLSPLDGSGSFSQTEEALRALGMYLGLNSIRPDKEFGTGPDVLWHLPGLPALCIEAKTDKEANSRYQKKELGQLNDHIQWVRNNTDAETVIPVFVGPIVGSTDTANPPDIFLVIALSEFKALSDSLTAALTDAASQSLPITLQSTLFKVFQERNLLWPECFGTLKSRKLVEL